MEISETEKDVFSSLRSSLIQWYKDVEEKGISAIIEGKTVENPILTGKLKDSRYSIAAIGLISGSLDSFLQKAIEKLKDIEPNAEYNSGGFRHITFREVIFNKDGRKAANISSKKLMDYYTALRVAGLPNKEPVCLELYRIIASIDHEQPSVSIIAALLPKDLNIITVRKGIGSVVENSRRGDIPIVHVTLARLPYPPKRDGNKVPLLDGIGEINKTIPSNCETVIDSVDVISTTPISYVDVGRHVFIWPPISLVGQQSDDPIRYLRPKERLKM